VAKHKLKAATSLTNSCHCGLPLAFSACCGAIIAGQRQAATAEQLMRSRYSAFCTHNKNYILASWHVETRPQALDLDDQQQWFGLKILKLQDGTALHQTGMVEFVARYKVNGKASRLHEISQFVYIDGLWFYTTGELLS